MRFFLRKLSKIRLSSAEREFLRSSLLTFMESHQVRNEIGARQILKRARFSNFFSLQLRTNTMIAIFLIAAIIAASGTTTFAAEGSLPGDILYPVKIHVNENVRSALTVGQEAEAEWQSKRVERRLEEAALLTVEERLDAETEAEVNVQLQKHIESAKKHTDALEARGDSAKAVEIQTHLEAVISAHKTIFKKFEAEASGNVKELMLDVNTVLEDVSKNRSKLDTQAKARGDVSLENSIQLRMNNTEKLLENIQSKLDKIETNIDAEDKTEIQSRVNAAQGSYAESKSRFESKAFDESYDLIQNSFKNIHEADTLVDFFRKIRVKGKVSNTNQNTNQNDTRDEYENEDKEDNVDEDGDHANNDESGVEIEGEGNVNVNIGQDGDLDIEIRIKSDTTKNGNDDAILKNESESKINLDL